MGAVSERIDSIIAVRRENAGRIEAAAAKLADVRRCVMAFERIQNNMEDYAFCFGGNSEAAGIMRNISLSGFYSAAARFSERLEWLKGRFSRERLNISFVGRAGHGKSLVLQKISGLPKSVIPSSDGSDCTGAKSVIVNRDDVSAPYARITFFSGQEMTGIVNDYIEAVTHDPSLYVHDVTKIGSLDLGRIEEASNGGVGNEKLIYLRKYVEHVHELEGLLGRTMDVGEDRIEEYVAQYSSSDSSVKYYKYLGVKTAEIFCRFPHEDTGRIVLVDTIGLGDQSLGVEGSMLDTVEKDSDAVVLMFRPDPKRWHVDAADSGILDSIVKRTSEKYTEKLFFWGVNKVSSGTACNSHAIGDVIGEIEKRRYPIAGVLTFDASDKDSVEAGLLVPVLNRMADVIGDFDEMMMAEAAGLGRAVTDELGRICSELDKAFVSGTSEDFKRSMERVILNTFRKKVLNNIRELYLHEYNPKRNEPYEVFKAKSEEITNSIRKFVPSREDVIALLEIGDLSQHEVLLKCFNSLRIRIIDAFLELNDCLSDFARSVKLEILGIVADDDKGRLGKIVPLGDSPDEWISAFLKKVEAEKRYPLICAAFRKLYEFEMSVQGFLIFEVRDKLDGIDQTLMKSTPVLNSGLGDKEKLADEIIEELKDCVYDIRGGISRSVAALSKIPNRAVFAAAKDFYDRAAFSCTASGSAVGGDVDLEWRHLYEDWIQFIWKEEYACHESSRRNAEELDSVVGDLRKSCSERFFEIRRT